jgi:catechol-2,3-dioxygenase
MTTTQAVAPLAGVPSLGAVTHVALTVRDLAVSVPWYRALIRADPVLDEDTGPFRHVVFALGDTLLGLHVFPEGIEDVEHSPRRPGLDHVAFGCADRRELLVWQQRLDAMGVPHGGIVDAHYGSALSFKDPDGLPLELFCPPAA